ncbi:MAG: hypothetical protein HKP34_07860 [Nitrosopumilus sp.]|nr:hypothetical protein [Nitrosopumilus sp.]NNL38200.1 hypothetical protein [Nitrosopumilus sp.]
MTELQLAGSGGWIYADVTEEQVTKSKLVPNMDKHFLAPIGKLDTTKMLKHFCKQCDSEFEGPTKIQIEEQPNEAVADGLILIERGQYTCHKCNSIIGEYRVFQKKDE